MANPGGPYTGTAGTAVAFSGAGSSDPQGQALTYAWNFGDNATGSGVSPSHTYAMPGTYTVTLTATDTSNLSNAATSKATIAAAPPTANAGGPYTGVVGTAVNLLGTGSTDPQGEALTYAWNFGDNSTGTGANPTHTYAAAGTYTVTLTVTDTSSLSNTATSKATIAPAPPVANAGGPYPGIEGVALNFSGSGSTDPQGETLTYSWNFGDGNMGTGVAPTHTYAAVGMYTVKLTVTNTSSLSNTATAQVLVPNGRAYVGHNALAGAHVYLFAANTTGYGGMGLAASSTNASVSLLSAASTGQSDAVGAYVLTGVDGSFFIAGDYSCTPGSQVYLYALGGSTGSGTNTGIGLLSALGACPSTGNFAATPYVVMNEVSTIATAYAFAGFATDATHVSSSGTALAKVGIANAFANAPNLETLGTGVALATTPAANGTVPQAEINSLANILASCTGTSAAGSNGCTLLFGDALSAGSTGATPTDTASAAINIVHNPGVNVAALYGLGAGAALFTPGLGAAPNDFVVALSFTGGGLLDSTGVAVDGSGNIWVSDGSSLNGDIGEFSPSGAAISGSNGYTGGGLSEPVAIAIDSSENVWVTNLDSLSKFNSSGTAVSGSGGYFTFGVYFPLGIAIESSGNVWVANTENQDLSMFGSNGVSIGYTSGGGVEEASDVAIDGSGKVWATNYNNSLSEFSSSGTAISGTSGYTGGGLSEPYGVAIDSSGNVWVSNSSGNSLSKFSSTGTALSGSTGYTGGGLSVPEGIAIDGSSNVWVSNVLTPSISEFNSSGTAISGPNGYTGGGLGQGRLMGIAIDGSGNVWHANSSNSITEFVGAAAPVVTPIVAGLPTTPTADGSSSLGTRP